MAAFTVVGFTLGTILLAADHSAQPLCPVVEVQEDVYRYEPADNGAGPMWCAGSTCLARVGERVFASGLETLAGQKPLNNCRWLLYARTADGWKLVQRDGDGRTREPCPVAGLPGDRLFLSVNPTRTAPGAYGGPAEPQILQFTAADPQAPFQTLQPQWNGSPEFTEHSYRSFAADADSGALILFQNIGYTHAEFSYRDGQGNGTASGKLVWPWGAEYDHPQPIRVCYPNVQVRGRAVHFCGVSDIVEPYTAWRDFKKQLTGRDWDYDFRRLFYTWTDDITTGQFHDWMEVASRDQTAGRIFPCDLWVDPDKQVHILWTEQALDTRLREKFFPSARQSQALNYVLVRDGKIAVRRSLFLAQEGRPGLTASAARFQITPDNRLLVICFVSGTDSDGRSISENQVLEIGPGGVAGAAVPIPLKPPFTSFFTATVRAGSPSSEQVDLLGVRAGSTNTISYACVRLW